MSRKKVVEERPMKHSPAIMVIYEDGSVGYRGVPSVTATDEPSEESGLSEEVFEQWKKGLSERPPEPANEQGLTPEEQKRLKLYQLSK